jgi:Zn/Cd-binding protein ZinT
MSLSLGDPDYWDERYREEEKMFAFKLFDWYAPFKALYPMVETVIDTTIQHKILVIGVGRSSIVEVLYDKGFRDITAIDISQTVIRQVGYIKYYDLLCPRILTIKVSIPLL